MHNSEWHRSDGRTVTTLLATATGAGCGSGRDTIVTDQRSARFPSETLRDWVSHADYVAT